MKTRFSLFLLLVLAIIQIPAYAETDSPDNAYLKKCNPELKHFLRNYSKQGSANFAKSFSKRLNPDNLVHVTLVCSDPESISQDLGNHGISVRCSLDNMLTAYIPADKLAYWASKESVRRLIGMDQYSTFLKNSRSLSDVNRLHSGTGLQTPYTGKGVIVSLLDEGIQYDHLAFRESDDSTRIITAINFNNTGHPVLGSKNILAMGEDSMNAYHGTHVLGIMAGGKTMGSTTYYGMAPEALIVAASRKHFSYSETVESLYHTAKIADSLGMPFVFNMSYGTQNHPHDAADQLSESLNNLVDKGLILVASAGNSGDDSIHFRHQFATANETRYIGLSDFQDDYCLAYLTGQDSIPFSAKLYMKYNNSTQMVPIPESWLGKTLSGCESFLDTDNGKFSIQMYLDTTGFKLPDNVSFVLGITSSQAGQIISGWNANASFSQLDANNIAPDNMNSIGWPAIVKNIICVGSYNSSNTWTTISNKTYGLSSMAIGTLSYFSSQGPTENPDILKPDVCAPGMYIASAGKRNCSSLSRETKTNAVYTVERISHDGTYHVYAICQGTSMASPATAGIIALWLQAKPDLTQKEIMQVIKETSKPFTGQNQSEWDLLYGYGKIQAYEGLKKVLALPSAIATIRNTSTPVTLLKQDKEWKILFNSGENFADINVCTINGTIVKQMKLENIRRGQEEILSFNNLDKGFYIISIKTKNYQTSQKIIVR